MTLIERKTVADAGWYADPNDASIKRWWDGTAWTMNVHRAEKTDVRAGVSAIDELALLMEVANRRSAS